MDSLRSVLRRGHRTRPSISKPVSESVTDEATSVAPKTIQRLLPIPIGAPTTNGSANPKIYKSIPVFDNEIRILTLLPGARGSKMCCELRSESLDSPPSYEALSYAWGDSMLTRLAWVNGNLMGVSQNLELALENLRSPLEKRSLWIDAICINQGNLEERNRQVALMRHIYRKAQRVLVWLGEKNEHSDLAFVVIDTLSADTKLLENSLFFTDQIFLKIRENADTTIPTVTEIPDETMDALRDIFSWRSWWSRIWVIQEVVSAREALLICGEKSLSWTLLEKLLDPTEQTILAQHALPKVRAQLASTMHTAIVFAAVRKQYHSSLRKDLRDESNMVYKYGLCPLLALFESNICTDPRDRIYALQNITGNEGGIIDPDYRKDIMEVFAQSTQQIIATTGDLDILAYAYRSKDVPHTGPSWAPDWSTSRQFSTLIAGPSRKRPYQADQDDFQYAHSHGIEIPSPLPYWLLGLVGYIKDEITQVLRVVNTEDPNWRHWFQHWLPDRVANAYQVPPERLRSEPPYYLSKESYYDECDEYWRALMLDVRRPPVGWPVRVEASPASIDVRFYRNSFLNWSQHPRYADYQEGILPIFKKMPSENLYTETSFEESMGEHLNGWAFCQMKNGSYGWAPQTARVGDLICIAVGSSLPLVLRKPGLQLSERVKSSIWWASKEKFEFVGTAYVQGYMDGFHWSHEREEYKELYLV